MAILIQFRRATSTEWQTVNPVLAEGEPGFEIDTGRFKIGDGTTRWNDLPYFSGGGGVSPAGNIGDIQYKQDDTSLGASAKLNWDITNECLRIGHTDEPTARVHIDGLVKADVLIERLQKNLFAYKPGLIIPFYRYPWNVDTWDSQFLNLISILKMVHNVPCIVILNPSSGPGTTEDAVYRRAIKMLHGAGAIVAGYVYSDYTNRAYDDVKNDIDQWLTLYPHIDTIFIDQMTNDEDVNHIEYYQNLTKYCHRKGLWPVIGNAGSLVPSEYFLQDCADVIVIHESSVIPSESDLEGGDWEDSYRELPYWRRAVIVTKMTPDIDQASLYMMQKYCGFTYVTDQSDYSNLATYIAEEVLFTSRYHVGHQQITFEADFNSNCAVFTLQQISGSGTVTIDWNLGNKVALTITGDVTLVFKDPPKSANLLLKTQQDATGGHSLTFPSNVKWPDGMGPNITDTPNAIDIFTFFFDGTDYYGIPSYNYS